MKRLVMHISILFIVFGGACYGATSDEFKCKITYKVDNNIQFETEGLFAAVRIPEVSAAGLTQTSARIKMGTGMGSEFPSATLGLEYKHAMKKDASGAWKAVQYFCSTYSAVFLDVAVSSACLQPLPNPFSPDSNWRPTDIEDGVPVLNPPPLMQTLNGQDGESVKISCSYIRTIP